MADYKLSSAAEDDLDRLFVYGVLNFGMQHTERYSAGLIEHLEALASSPLLYQAVDHIRPGYRRSVYRAHSIYYRIEVNDVRIIRILSHEDPNQRLP